MKNDCPCRGQKHPRMCSWMPLPSARAFLCYDDKTLSGKHTRKGSAGWLCYRFTASFMAFPGLKEGSSQAVISIGSPVLGLRPVLAPLCLREKVPKFGRVTLPPLATSCVIVFSTAVRALSTAFCGMSVSAETDAISSVFVMAVFSFLCFAMQILPLISGIHHDTDAVIPKKDLLCSPVRAICMVTIVGGQMDQATTQSIKPWEKTIEKQRSFGREEFQWD